MNRDWVGQRLKQYELVCRQWLNAEAGSPEETKAAARLHRELPTVRKILHAVDPALAERVSRREPDTPPSVQVFLVVIRQAAGIVADQEAVAANLAPESPVLVADQFHEHVWSAAAPLWETGQYRVAVQQTITALSAHIRQKAGSHLADRALVQSVFASGDPGPSQPRLHFPKGDGATNETWKSRQDGLHLVAQGAFAGIRNVATHTDDEWTEQVALEQLAVLSIVARWADETELVEMASALEQPGDPSVGAAG